MREEALRRREQCFCECTPSALKCFDKVLPSALKMRERYGGSSALKTATFCPEEDRGSATEEGSSALRLFTFCPEEERGSATEEGSSALTSATFCPEEERGSAKKESWFARTFPRLQSSRTSVSPQDEKQAIEERQRAEKKWKPYYDLKRPGILSKSEDVHWYLPFATFMLVFIHPTCGTTMLQLFNCEQLYFQESGMTYFLVLDRQVECFTAQWYGLALMATVILVTYIIGMPLALAVGLNQLHSKKRVLWGQEVSHGVIQCLMGFGSISWGLGSVT
ncbi:hypothetical protein CYMTET_22328, partial [Cymbomonas tetramitiformis]